MDKREWTWATVPVLVGLFSVGAYGFGASTKSRTVFQNIASVVEMGANTGAARMSSSIGIFSPSRTQYVVSVDGAPNRDTLLWSDNSGLPGTNEYAPLEVAAGENGSVTARNVDISQWAMRVVRARSNVQVGDGIQMDLRRENHQIIGTVTNQTGHPITDALLTVDGAQQQINTLAPGESRQIALPALGVEMRQSALSSPYSLPPGIEQSIRADICGQVGEALNKQISRENTGTARINDRVLLSGWSDAPLLTVRVNGKDVSPTKHVNLLLVHGTLK